MRPVCRYIALRPKIEYDLGRTWGESWGFTVSAGRVPLVVDSVAPNGIAERGEMEAGDILVSINGVSALDNPTGAVEQLNVKATSLVVLTTKYWLGGLTHEAQNEKRKAVAQKRKVRLGAFSMSADNVGALCRPFLSHCFTLRACLRSSSRPWMH